MEDQKLTFELPGELAEALFGRCQEWSIWPDELVAALLLQHFQWTSSNISAAWRLLDALDDWKAGDRKLRTWRPMGRGAEEG
jgi:hypothetical protein